MLYFAAILDSNYLSRLITMYDSLSRYHKQFTIFIICLDDNLYEHLRINVLPNSELVRLSELESFYPELIEVKKERGIIDYIFTLSPFYPSFILEKHPEIPFICSLDVDQYFFGNCETVLRNLDTCSVLITPHRFSDKLREYEKYGIYNVSFQIFKNNDIGKACLELWREQCLHWCKDELDGDRFADQKYLNVWQDSFGAQVLPIDNPGFGLAPWNIENYSITVKNRKVYVDDNELVLFHYQGLRFLNASLVNSGFCHYQVATSKVVTRFILQPIIANLSKATFYKGKDTIKRVIAPAEKGLLNQVNAEGFFFLLGKKIISMDRVHYFNNYIKRFSGLLNRFKNIYR